jgi:hypothetical protein
MRFLGTRFISVTSLGIGMVLFLAHVSAALKWRPGIPVPNSSGISTAWRTKAARSGPAYDPARHGDVRRRARP